MLNRLIKMFLVIILAAIVMALCLPFFLGLASGLLGVQL